MRRVGIIPRMNSGLAVFMMISSLYISSLAGVYASAQADRVYTVTVGIGDSATYIIDETVGWGLRAGDNISFVVRQIETVKAYFGNSSVAFSYQQADCNWTANNYPLSGRLTFVIPFGFNRSYWQIGSNGSYWRLAVPFLPSGSDFPKTISSCYPAINSSSYSLESVLMADFVAETESSFGNTTEREIYRFHEMITIDTTIGVATKIEYSNTNQHISNQPGENYTVILTTMSMSLVSMNIASTVPPNMRMPLIVLAGAIPVALLTIAYIGSFRRRETGEPHRKRRAEASEKVEETAKNRLLNDLTYRELFETAKSVSEDITAGTKREEIIKTIKDSLSIEEIKNRVRKSG